MNGYKSCEILALSAIKEDWLQELLCIIHVSAHVFRCPARRLLKVLGVELTNAQTWDVINLFSFFHRALSWLLYSQCNSVGSEVGDTRLLRNLI